MRLSDVRVRWFAKPRHHLHARHRKILPRTNVKRNAIPPPRINLKLQTSKRLHLRVRRNTLLIQIATELPANQILRLNRRNGLKHLHLLITHRLSIASRRTLHREIAHHLEDMVLNHIANRARLVIKSPTTLNPKVLRHRDLNSLNIVTIPNGFQERIRKAKGHHVMHWPLRKVMIDAKD